MVTAKVAASVPELPVAGDLLAVLSGLTPADPGALVDYWYCKLLFEAIAEPVNRAQLSAQR